MKAGVPDCTQNDLRRRKIPPRPPSRCAHSYWVCFNRACIHHSSSGL